MEQTAKDENVGQQHVALITYFHIYVSAIKLLPDLTLELLRFRLESH